MTEATDKHRWAVIYVGQPQMPFLHSTWATKEEAHREADKLEKVVVLELGSPTNRQEWLESWADSQVRFTEETHRMALALSALIPWHPLRWRREYRLVEQRRKYWRNAREMLLEVQRHLGL